MCRKFHSSRKTQFALHALAHVKPFRVVKLKEISITMHLRIISAESDNITNRKSGGFCKEKHIYVEIAQMKATRLLRAVVA